MIVDTWNLKEISLIDSLREWMKTLLTQAVVAIFSKYLGL